MRQSRVTYAGDSETGGDLFDMTINMPRIEPGDGLDARSRTMVWGQAEGAS